MNKTQLNDILRNAPKLKPVFQIKKQPNWLTTDVVGQYMLPDRFENSYTSITHGVPNLQLGVSHVRFVGYVHKQPGEKWHDAIKRHEEQHNG